MDIDISALRALANDQGLDFARVRTSIEAALLAAYRQTPGHRDHATVRLDLESGRVSVWAKDDAAGPEFDDTPAQFGRIAAATARSVLRDMLREASSLTEYEQFSRRVGTVVAGTIQQGRDPRMVFVDLGPVEGVIPPSEQVQGEEYTHGLRIKAYLWSVKRDPKGIKVVLSRTHPDLVRELFKFECPEVSDGTVEIVSVAREAGFRTKIAVRSHVAGVNAKGSCIGPMGQRVRAVTHELQGEKIDIVDWDEDRAQYVANALSPARVVGSKLVDEETNSVQVVVPDFQLSLAIGRDGQNARLAARLTGCRIDIASDAAPVD